ncbi:hypothetical protein C3L33_15655, partial [Rhododendron williamsianum]
MRTLGESLSRDIIRGNPDVKWESIKGLENAKRLLKEAVVMPIKYPKYFTGLLSPWKGQGAKLARAAGTFAKIMKEPAPPTLSLRLVRLPSGVEKVIDSRCRATIGIVSNPNHGARKQRKAGQSRWLGRRPIVRGLAMNPVDDPHGGGEGCTKGGRPSVSPWGKPTKAGFRAGVGKGRNEFMP